MALDTQNHEPVIAGEPEDLQVIDDEAASGLKMRSFGGASKRPSAICTAIGTDDLFKQVMFFQNQLAIRDQEMKDAKEHIVQLEGMLVKAEEAIEDADKLKELVGSHFEALSLNGRRNFAFWRKNVTLWAANGLVFAISASVLISLFRL